MVTNKILIGEVIRSYRKLKGLTQEKFADKLGISQQQLQKYENDTSRPPLEMVANISRELGIPIQEFFPNTARRDLAEVIEKQIKPRLKIVRIIEDYPELKGVIEFYARNRENLTGVNIVKLLERIVKTPTNKKSALISLFNRLASSL